VPCLGALVLAGAAANAQMVGGQLGQGMTPGWTFEIKGGRFEPDLEAFASFYGEEDTGYYAGSFAYRFKPWLEAGAEAGYMHDRGVGIAVEQGVAGGGVVYELLPLHFHVTLRGQFKPDQLFVPYVGLGVTSAYYRQEIELQEERTGWSDVGSFGRLGLELYLNRVDPGTAGGLAEGVIKQSYLYLEAQRFTAEKEGHELGGDALVLGLRFTFGPAIEQRLGARSAPR
jgi:hypothetical protein